MTTNDDLTEFERDLLESVRQARHGEFAAVHTPEMMAARNREHPAGTAAATRKASTTIRLDADVMGAFKASGRGWQTRINTVLREALAQGRV